MNKRFAAAMAVVGSLVVGPAALAAPGEPVSATKSGREPAGAKILDHGQDDHGQDDHDHDGDGRPDHDPEDHEEEDKDEKPKPKDDDDY